MKKKKAKKEKAKNCFLFFMSFLIEILNAGVSADAKKSYLLLKSSIIRVSMMLIMMLVARGK